MKRAVLIAACVISLGACTTVKINHDGSNTIAHDAKDDGKALADRACKKAGEQGAIEVSTVNKDASLPAGTGRQLTTFRCSSSAPR